MKQLAALCALVLLESCAGPVPGEVTTGVAIQSEAWANVQANVKTIVLAYDRELRASYDKQLDDYFLADTRPEGVAERYRDVRKKQREIYADLDKKRDEFLSDPNIAIGKMAGDLLTDWVRTSDESYSRIRELISTVKGVRK